MIPSLPSGIIQGTPGVGIRDPAVFALAMTEVNGRTIYPMIERSLSV